jgi:hypothetical protein
MVWIVLTLEMSFCFTKNLIKGNFEIIPGNCNPIKALKTEGFDVSESRTFDTSESV